MRFNIHVMNNIWLLILSASLAHLTPTTQGQQAPTPDDQRDVVAPLESWGVAADADPIPFDPDIVPEHWTVLPCKPGEADLLRKGHLADWISKIPSAGQTLNEQGREFQWVALSDKPEASAIACAIAEVTVTADEVRMLHAPGIRILWVNGQPFQGDPENRGFLGSPVTLRKGVNRVVVVNPEQQWRVRFWRPRTQIVLASWASSPIGQTPSEMGNPFINRFVPAYNVSLEAAKYVHIHYGSPRSPSIGEPFPSEWKCGRHIDPLELVDIPTSDMASGQDLTYEDEFAFYKVLAYEGGENFSAVAELPLKLLTVPTNDLRPRGWIVNLPNNRVPDDQKADPKRIELQFATHAFFRWLLQNTLYKNNGWASLAEDGWPDSSSSRNKSFSRLYLGNERNCSSLRMALKSYLGSKEDEETNRPAPPRVTNGKMVCKGKEYVGPDWYFVYRPSENECFLLMTGPQALPALALAFGRDPEHFASTEPSR